jgi:hypothetical protein
MRRPANSSEKSSHDHKLAGMETKPHRPAAPPRLVSRLSPLFGVALATIATMLPTAQAQAGSDSLCGEVIVCGGDFSAVAPGFSVRNGDWLTVDALGVLMLDTRAPIAAVARGEIGIGGSSLGIGLATNFFGPPQPWTMSDFLMGIFSLEARVERMYGPTTWRSTTYVGGQLSWGLMIFGKPALAWMVAADDAHEEHFQFVFFGAGW